MKRVEPANRVMADLDEVRQRAGLTIKMAALKLRIGERSWRRAMRGKVAPPWAAPGIKTLANLGPVPLQSEAVYRLALALLAALDGVPLTDVMASSPQHRATNDPAWMRAARLRRRAVYVVNTVVGLRQAVVARATGLTPAAISLACRAVEDERDDPAVDRQLALVAAVITGEGPNG